MSHWKTEAQGALKGASLVQAHTLRAASNWLDFQRATCNKAREESKNC